jgi:protein-tyrosine-phosphatase
MTDLHLRQLASLVPEAAIRMSLLRRDNGNIADPVGLDIDAYRRSAHEIEANLKAIVAELVP